MDLQTVFYSVGIIFMTLGILVAFAILLLLFYIRVKVAEVQMNVVRRVNSVFDPANVALHLGYTFIKRIKKLIQKKF